MAWTKVIVTHICPYCGAETNDTEDFYIVDVVDIKYNLRTKHCNFCDYSRSSGIRTDIVHVEIPVKDSDNRSIFGKARG